MHRNLICTMAVAGLLVFANAPTEAANHAANPCAANPCAANPCAANPCNPCAAKGAARGLVTVRTVWGQVVSASPQMLVVKADGSSLDLQLTKQTEIKMAGQGLEKKSIDDLRPGTRVAVSFLEDKGSRRAAYVYLARAAANPCAANPCGAKNPCAANPCAAKNPCAANPCAAKNPCVGNPCAPKNPCAPNPCAAKNPCNPCGARK